MDDTIYFQINHMMLYVKGPFFDIFPIPHDKFAQTIQSGKKP